MHGKAISDNKPLCGKIRLTDNLIKNANLMKNGLLYERYYS